LGQATCSRGYSLVFGGRTKDHDVVVCTDAGGDLEYYGIKRSTGADIRLDDVCQSSSRQFTAWNGPNRYSVDSSQITVFEADGRILLRESFQTTEEDSRPGLTLC
jgi:hypothetical protein